MLNIFNNYYTKDEINNYNNNINKDDFNINI